MSTRERTHAAVGEHQNVILVANPSHSAPAEHAFWCAVAGHLQERGWFLVEIATRLLPHTPAATTLCFPARLGDLNRCLESLPPDASQPSTRRWWSDDDYAVQEDWEYRRWGLEERLPAALLGLMRLVSMVDACLDALRPSLVLTLNKIDHNVSHFRRAAQARGIPAWVVERSPLDGIWLEPDGLFAESEIWRRYPGEEVADNGARAAAGRRLRDRLVANPKGFRATQAASAEIERIRALPRPHVFVPMDNVLWTGWAQPHHPMNRVDNPLYPTPAAALADLQAHTAARGGSLLVKPHPACRDIDADSVPDGAHFVRADLGALLATADVVACFNTKVAFPALALGRSVVTLAPNPVAASGATYHCRDRQEVGVAIDAALDGADLETRLSNFESYLGWLSNDFLYTCEETAAQGARGPRSFARRLIEVALDCNRRLSAPQLEEAVSTLAETTAARRPRLEEAAPSPSGGASLVGKGFATLVRRGPAELTRKVLVHGLSRLDTPAVQRLAGLLDRLGVDIGELKARFPYLVTYNHRTSPLSDIGELNSFRRLWRRGLGPHGSLHPTGCSTEQRRAWDRLKDLYSGQRLWVIGTDVPLDDVPAGARRGASLLLDRADGAKPEWRPTFHLTVGEDAAKRFDSPPVDRCHFLPQSLRGFTADDRQVLWFGPRRPQQDCEAFSDDPREGLYFGDHPFEPAAQIAAFLGYREIWFLTSDAGRERLTATSKSLRRRRIELRFVEAPAAPGALAAVVARRPRGEVAP